MTFGSITRKGEIDEIDELIYERLLRLLVNQFQDRDGETTVVTWTPGVFED